jgi:hypothetical protein
MGEVQAEYESLNRRMAGTFAPCCWLVVLARILFFLLLSFFPFALPRIGGAAEYSLYFINI